eukprot:CAMPEP_0176451010 /NCGR_PEP_ID=MMETSP0127-20121128/27528_1 /TAXON_ID=938130 /ORGANISM="Platyophrya macrostoma, Strain WH" /LENGTH=216 /DNA_ID=CAMNT_0017838877 /DNA_START=28 /DNA_END=678 /DNA_ORIENTATION=+
MEVESYKGQKVQVEGEKATKPGDNPFRGLQEKRMRNRQKNRRIKERLIKKKKMNIESQPAPKDFKQLLSDKYDEIRTKTGEELASCIARSFKEPNRELVQKIVRECGDAKTIEYVRDAMQIYASGGLERKEGPGTRTLGGTFFKIVKDSLDLLDPMKKAFVFQKNEESKKRRNVIKTQRRKERKHATAAIKSIFKNSKQDAEQKNPTKNPFAALLG